MKANDLSGFNFQFKSSGCYKVTYTTPNRGDYWVAYIDCMPLIDATLNAEWAKVSDIKHLRDMVKRNGTHYSSGGKRIHKYWDVTWKK